MRLPNIISFEEAEYSRLPRSRAASSTQWFFSPRLFQWHLLQKEWTYHVTCMCTLGSVLATTWFVFQNGDGWVFSVPVFHAQASFPFHGSCGGSCHGWISCQPPFVVEISGVWEGARAGGEQLSEGWASLVVGVLVIRHTFGYRLVYHPQLWYLFDPLFLTSRAFGFGTGPCGCIAIDLASCGWVDTSA